MQLTDCSTAFFGVLLFLCNLSQVDQQLTSQMTMMINAGMGVIGAAGAIIFATPLFTLGMAPLSFVYVRIMNYFRQVARELKRLDSITRYRTSCRSFCTLGDPRILRLSTNANDCIVGLDCFTVTFALVIICEWTIIPCSARETRATVKQVQQYVTFAVNIRRNLYRK